MAKDTEPTRRSTGGVGKKETVAENLRPTGGYDTVEVVQYNDESDEQFAKRVADFETRRATAEAIENAGDPKKSFDSSLKALDARYEVDKAALEANRDTEIENRK